MKKAIVYGFMFLCTLPAFAQEWTEPVKVNTLQGYNNNPDFCISNDGTIHCVWSYRIESNHRIIYYSKSTDDGQTWSTPENVSQNTSMWMENPHIVSDSETNLHLTYDMDIGSGATFIGHRKFNSSSWNELDTVSPGWPGARHNRLVIDHNDKLYGFWFHEYQGGTTFYRVLENDEWGEIMIPYDNNDSYFLSRAVVDTTNKVHCSGYRFFEGQSSYDQEIVYSYYYNQNWSDLTQISQDYQPWAGNDIALDDENNPKIVWRQAVSNNIPANDGTLFSEFDGTNWSTPLIIVEDPSDQAIAIDKNNKAHIVDNEKFENGYRLVHYQFINNEWVGEIIEEDNYGYFDNSLYFQNMSLYLLTNKVDTVIGSKAESSIVLRKFEITTSITNGFTPSFNSYKIYPNPSSGRTTISYSLQEGKQISIKIYDLQGKLINTIIDKKQAPGKYQIMWNGTDKNKKEVNSGLYLIRLQAGRQVMTRSVEIIK